MGFRFQLQRVLEMRNDVARQCELRFEALVRRCDELRLVLTTERDSYLTEREELNNVIRQAQFEPIRMYEISLETRKKRMIQVLEQLRALEEDKVLAEQDMVRARRDVKVIEKYRDKKSKDYEKKIETAERKFFDEQSTIKHARLLRDEKKG